MKDLGLILDHEMEVMAFKIDGGIVPPSREVNFAGLFDATMALYQTEKDRIDEFLKVDLNRQRFAALDRR